MLVEDDGLHQADAAIVLGGDEYGDRILKAAQTVRDGYAPYVLVSFQPRLWFCDQSVKYAESKGYPASFFREVPNHTVSTREEAKFLVGYARAHSMHSILLVTSNYHTRRAAYLMRQQAPSLAIYAVPSNDPFFSANGWWKTREGQKTFVLEWTKTVMAHLGD